MAELGEQPEHVSNGGQCDDAAVADLEDRAGVNRDALIRGGETQELAVLSAAYRFEHGDRSPSATISSMVTAMSGNA